MNAVIEDYDVFAGKTPKGICKLVKSGELTRGDLDRAFAAAFDEYDPDNPDHEVLQTRIAEQRALLDERDALMAEKQAEQKEAQARIYFLENGIEPASVPKAAMAEIANLLWEKLTATEETAVELTKDTDRMVLTTPSGEVVAFLDAPDTGGDIRRLLEYVGKRLADAEAKKAALLAEQQVWLDKIAATYGKSIARLGTEIKGVEYIYGPVAEQYAKDVRAAAIKAGGKPPATITVGLLTITCRAASKSTEVTDDAAGVATLRELELDDAVKTVESVLVNKIPAEVLEALPPESGIEFYPGGKEVYKIK